MTYQLKIAITSFWHPGTGLGQGYHTDARTHRANNLPVLPGRTIKGIVREAVAHWENFCPNPHEGVPVADQLFGPKEDGTETWPGLLRFSSAGLPSAETAYLALEKQADLVAGLYRTHFSTAIEHDYGTAQENSLRGIEVVIPLTLYANIEIVPNARYPALQETWQEHVTPALSLIHAVGAHRSRGFGRATLSLVEG